ncbi:hypothetical protein O2N63_12465 [Aliiroseovarius sp. KMU-50]|uniref:Uncharacterized protein n=1 Tax=Aliiroseovarius salicola TaxID=3009082 RepID=A0ABT4W304_9RHOB|nr:hypothetical protein [Aliiroseovarius sp. KMU-50]MDA5094899.1 hypothetical protein [Aliiroseovarius sp. KMU-50]
MNLRQFLRMSKWARNPPSEKRVKLVLGVVALCLLLVGYEYVFGTPDWLSGWSGRPKFRP